ncbi:MAG: serine hydrolase [Bacteroidia bacterium]|nr:serine hydrolase [Bacteroidia bacterium]
MKKLLFPLLVLAVWILVSCNKSNDGYDFEWPVSTPSAEGMNQQKLDSACIKADELGFVDALLVLRNGHLVAEKYYNGYGVNTEHQIYSDTKSFMSALVGIALENGLIENLDKKIMDYFPEYIYSGMDSRFFDITVRHLLTMRMGIDKEENTLIPIVQTNDWIRETFNLPLLFDPGQKFSYNSLETHLLSAILTKVTGKSALEFAVENLTGPMGIEIIQWNHDPLGNNTGGYDIYMKPRDMAVLGYMYLNDGMINNTQIVSKEWVDVSLTRTWAANSKKWGPLTDYNYGYLWWLGKMNGYDLFMALGMGGQYVINFPDLDLIVVTTANKDISWDNEQEIPILEIVSKYILTAIN